MTHTRTRCQRHSVHSLVQVKLGISGNEDLSSISCKDESSIQFYYELSSGLRKVRIGRPTSAIAVVYLSAPHSRSQAHI
jgi:hypothetical protein